MKRKKNIKIFTFQNQKIIDGNSSFLLIYFSKFKILKFKYYFKILKYFKIYKLCM